MGILYWRFSTHVWYLEVVHEKFQTPQSYPQTFMLRQWHIKTTSWVKYAVFCFVFFIVFLHCDKGPNTRKQYQST